jgi:hypothetical protein
MINLGRWLIKLALIVLVSLFERVMGFPVVVMMLTSLYAARLDQGWRWGLLLAVGVLTSTLFMTPLSITWLVIGLNYIWAKHAQQLLPSRVMRLIIGSLVGSVVLVIFSYGQIYLRQLVYGLIAIFICIIWFKRYRFHLK